MLILFDLDGTLISGYMDTPGKVYDRWDVLPGRVACLAALRAAGHQVGLVTNQGGVAFGIVTIEQATAKLRAALTALGLPADTPVAVCYADTRSKDARYNDPQAAARRKPSGAMIREMQAKYPAAARLGCVFVGDRPEDAQAAADAAVAFAWAAEFFRPAPARQLPPQLIPDVY